MSDSDSTITRSSFSASNERKKRKNNLGSASAVSDNDRPAERSNRSHTSYFFHKDSNNDQIAYCIICERNLSDTNRKPYPYSRKGGSTSNLSCHLRDKHSITRYNYLDYLDS